MRVGRIIATNPSSMEGRLDPGGPSLGASKGDCDYSGCKGSKKWLM